MQDAPVARWRIVGFYVLFAVLPVATAAAAIAVAANAARWAFLATLVAAGLGALVGVALGRLPADMALPPWVLTAGIAAACFFATALHVSDTVAAIALGFAAGLLGVACVSLIVRRKRHPETFRGQASKRTLGQSTDLTLASRIAWFQSCLGRLCFPYGMKRRLVVLRGAVLAVGLASLALLAAGCGGSKTPSAASLGTTSQSKTTSTGAPLSPQQEAAIDDEYAACLNAHGAQARVIPSGGVVSVITPATQGRLAAARDACQKLLPKGGLPLPTKTQSAQLIAQMLKLAHCMRANGEPNFPDPTSNGIHIGASSGIDPQSPQFQAAQKACAKDFPGGVPP